MKKYKGFTLVELLVVIALLSSVAIVSGPSFVGMLDRYRLNESLTGMYDMMLEARSSSFAKKVCPTSGKAAVHWGVLWDGLNHSHTLTCEDVDGLLDLVETTTLSDSTIEIHPRSSDDTQDTATTNFLTQRMSSEIFFEGSPTFEDDIRIILSNTIEFRTLCFNAVQSFPTVNRNGNTCL